MKNRAGQPEARGEATVDQRAKVVRVNQCRFDAEDFPAKLKNSAGRETILLPKHRNIIRKGKTFGKQSAAFKAGDIDFELPRIQSSCNIHNAVFHPAGFQGGNDMQYFQWAGGFRILLPPVGNFGPGPGLSAAQKQIRQSSDAKQPWFIKLAWVGKKWP